MILYHASDVEVANPEIRRTVYAKDFGYGFYCTANYAQAMANDTIWNYVNDFISGTISREAFWALAKFRHPTHQVCFHTSAALGCIKFLKSETI